MKEVNTHGLTIDFGKHKGELWTRVPVSYLSWLANHIEENENILIARSELKRRGTTYQSIEISGHAVDRASMSCWKEWRRTKEEKEGLNSWLIRMSNLARTEGELKNGKYHYLGMKFVFEEGAYYPTLKSIMRN